VLNEVCVLNDYALRGRHGEKVIWSHLIERLGCSFMDCPSTGTKDGKALREFCRALVPGTVNRPRLWIQNASWNPPHAGGPEPYVAVLMDNLRRLKDDRAVSQTMALDHAEAIVANSEHFREDYPEFSHKMAVIPLGVDVDFFSRDAAATDPFSTSGARTAVPISPADRGSARPRRRAIFVGDATAQKGWLKVVALAELREDIDWTFVLKSFVERLMPPGRLEVHVPPEKVRDLLCASDVFVLGSTCEGGSQAPLEALACGLPVVMPPAGDFATWKPKSYFEVAAPYDGRAFDRALSKCLESTCDPRGDLLGAGRYDVASVVARWRALLEGILNGDGESVLSHEARAPS
jgi:glycosyltransferase involved in cell wall biosynthesis